MSEILAHSPHILFICHTFVTLNMIQFAYPDSSGEVNLAIDFDSESCTMIFIMTDSDIPQGGWSNTLKEHGISKVTLNMQGLEYMSSTGLRIILKMSKALGRENVILSNVNDGVMEVFETTGFTDVITIK